MLRKLGLRQKNDFLIKKTFILSNCIISQTKLLIYLEWLFSTSSHIASSYINLLSLSIVFVSLLFNAL